MREKIYDKLDTILKWTAIVSGIIAFIVFYILFKEPEPVGKDYLELYQKEQTYIDDLSNILELDEATMYVYKDKIEVYVYGNECQITSIFDKQYKYLKTTSRSNNCEGVECFAYSLTCSVYAILGFTFIVLVLYLIVDFVLYTIEKIINKVKLKAKNNEKDIDKKIM